mmetsp:Transcript_10505/g.14730  ORF Transcript_10505/g.14730 Transcript_10505/m.14730 type:complete len:251 (-) Transcript_10505:193-945(-)|eukprot:CAMPEP_0185732846 /NCGR_PEP_ID=MMETSP1171-20130828/17713_1 /TAXON_ID=374046 /ORGANISM="Helicotheca tamensis, Strain CCMP826" /LENGTH=250 /DNA_ID=CAMNT_0028402435 /DNA_START=49 /DNA_END=801 /DNA_ORIENTATION=-
MTTVQVMPCDMLLNIDIIEPEPIFSKLPSTSSTKSSAYLPSGKRVTKRNSKKPTKRKSLKKIKDKPKRPLSAYNFFFQSQREKIKAELQSNAQICESNDSTTKSKKGKVGFAQLARVVSERWKTLDPDTLSYFKALADNDKQRYEREMDEWTRRRIANAAPMIGPTFNKPVSTYLTGNVPAVPPIGSSTEEVDLKSSQNGAGLSLDFSGPPEQFFDVFGILDACDAEHQKFPKTDDSWLIEPADASIFDL